MYLQWKSSCEWRAGRSADCPITGRRGTISKLVWCAHSHPSHRLRQPAGVLPAAVASWDGRRCNGWSDDRKR